MFLDDSDPRIQNNHLIRYQNDRNAFLRTKNYFFLPIQYAVKVDFLKFVVKFKELENLKKTKMISTEQKKTKVTVIQISSEEEQEIIHVEVEKNRDEEFELIKVNKIIEDKKKFENKIANKTDKNCSSKQQDNAYVVKAKPIKKIKKNKFESIKKEQNIKQFQIVYTVGCPGLQMSMSCIQKKKNNLYKRKVKQWENSRKKLTYYNREVRRLIR